MICKEIINTEHPTHEELCGELRKATHILHSTHWNADIYTFKGEICPRLLREVAKLRIEAYRDIGISHLKGVDIDAADLDGTYNQLIVWDSDNNSIVGGYRYALCREVEPSKLSIAHYFNYTQRFLSEYMPHTIELGRSFISTQYQLRHNRKSIYTLDTLWQGIGAITYQHNIRHLLGRVTIYPTLDIRAQQLILGFMHHSYRHTPQLLHPLHPIDIEMTEESYADLFPSTKSHDRYLMLISLLRTMGHSLPPIISSYMRLSPSMHYFGSYINSDLGNTPEAAIMLSVADFYDDVKRRYLQKK